MANTIISRCPRRSVIAALLFLFPFCAYSQDLPDAPKPKAKAVWAVGTAVLAASKSADVFTTRQLLSRGGWENNPLYGGPHPSQLRQGGMNAAIFVMDSALFWQTEHSAHRWVRWAGRAYVAAVIVNHGRLAACNASIDVHSSRAQNCHGYPVF